MSKDYLTEDSDGPTTIKGVGAVTILFMIAAGFFGASAYETMLLAGALGFCVGTALMKW